jgi:LacI family transcriptional regulator
VAEETRARVLSAIGELNFVRNESARRLRQGPPVQGLTFGVVMREVTNPYYTDVAQGAESAINGVGADVIWCTSNGSPDKERRALKMLARQDVAGVLITPVGLGTEQIAWLHNQHIGIVVLDRRAHPAGVCSARVDHVAGGDVAVSHLLGLGRERIAFVAGAAEYEPSTERRHGAIRAMARAGAGDLHTLVQDGMTVTDGQDAARRLLEEIPTPCAVFCVNDLVAIGLINELLRCGVKVPQEVAVVGYDDIELAASAAVPLTTVRQPRQELGRVAAELALIEVAEGTGHPHHHIVLPPQLIVRDSA